MRPNTPLDRLAQPPDARLYLRPLLHGGPVAAFREAELTVRAGGKTAQAVLPRAALGERTASWPAALVEALAETLGRITAPRAEIAGLRPDRPLLAGIVNVTPDSFSDGGLAEQAGAALERIDRLIADGADIIDIGAESTRPGAEPISAGEEIRRLAPVLDRLPPGLVFSIDTRRAETMRFALGRGAKIINDVSALADDPDSLAVAAASEAAIVLMHKSGQPATMNAAPAYADVVLDVYDALEARIAACEAAGISRQRLVVDPGIGFGKTMVHGQALLGRLALLHGLGCPLMIGVSRKGLLGPDQALDPVRRLPGSLAACLWARAQGAALFRVHDVSETALALAVGAALAGAGREPRGLDAKPA